MRSLSAVKAVTFDCAQTLIAVDWRPAMLAVTCAKKVGLSFEETSAATQYDQLLRSRWTEFQELNLTRDSDLTDSFWRRLSLDWTVACGFPTEKVDDIIAVAEEELYGSDSSVFTLYDDVIPCLEALKARGIIMGVISNWDISLHRTLHAFGLSHYFHTVVASMEEGIEKPDPRIFELALSRMDCQPSEVVHVGDNPLDDLKGARSAGMRAYVIDRSQPGTDHVYLSSLSELIDRLSP